MNTEDKELLNTVLSKLEFQFIKDILVKPLPEEYIEKEMMDMLGEDFYIREKEYIHRRN